MSKLRVNLALQGGGAHGAFTWGVLDRLTREDDIEVAGISGTSAGALNGAALKQGLLTSPAEARAELERLWLLVGAQGDPRMAGWIAPWSPFLNAAADAARQLWPVSPAGLMGQVFTPYAFGSLWRNPLAPVVRHFDFSKVCADQGPELFVSATNVRSGKIRVFEGREITPEAILASACLPTIFQTVEFHDATTGQIEGFWDGGYSGNPALFPLFRADLPDDIIVVNINPLRREDIPQSPVDIQNRINEISFNSSLLRELRAIDFVKRLIADGVMERGRMKDLRLHMIADDALMNRLGADSKLAPTALLLHQLREAGHKAADRFLTRHKADLGQRPSLDLRGMFG
jgi:NTE family protein